MKVLFTVNTYYPLNDGVQFVTQYLAEGLASKGHDVTVFTRKEKDFPEQETYNGVNIRRFDIRSNSGIYYGKIKAYKEKVIEEGNKSDVMVNVALQCVASDLALSVLNKINCHKILYLHGRWEFGWSKQDFFPLQNILFKLWANARWKWLYLSKLRTLRHYDKIIQLSEFLESYQFFKKKGFSNQVVINNAVQNDFFKNACTDISIELPEKYMLCVANYCIRKNQEFLIDSYFSAQTEIPLVLIGGEENSYYLSLKEKVSKKVKNKKVFLLTHVPRKDISLITSKASLYVLGSKQEHQPVSIYESIASGVPFISTDVGCVRCVPGGVIVNNKDEMSYWMDFFSSNDEIRKEYGKIGKAYALTCCKIEDKVNMFDKLLKELT